MGGYWIVLSNGCNRCKLCSATFHVIINEQVCSVSTSSRSSFYILTDARSTRLILSLNHNFEIRFLGLSASMGNKKTYY